MIIFLIFFRGYLLPLKIVKKNNLIQIYMLEFQLKNHFVEQLDN